MGNPALGERIFQRRTQLGMTLDYIADEIGVAKSTIQRYEKGQIDKIKLPIIEAIARVLRVNPAWLCGKSNDMKIPATNTDTSNLFPPDLTARMEEFLETLSPEQAALLCVLAERMLEPVKEKASRK